MNYEQEQLNKEITKKREELDLSERSGRAEGIIKFLDKIKAYEICKQLISKQSEEDALKFDEFKAFLIRLNGLARGIPIKERNFDGKNVELSGGLLGEVVLPPKYENKEELLKYAFESAKDLSADDNSYMIPAVVNSLHMFNDSNGRTSRIIHLLLAADSKEEFDIELKKALGPDGRFDSLDINPGMIDWEIEQEVSQNHGWYFDPVKKTTNRHVKLKGGIASAEYNKVDYDDGASGENLKKYVKIARSNDFKYILTATVESLSDEQYNSILLEKTGVISPLKMQKLNAAEWGEIFHGYDELKKEHIKILIDIFKNPDNHRSSYDENENLRDLFIRKINERFQNNKQV